MRRPRALSGAEHHSHVLGVEVEDHQYAGGHDRVDVTRLEPGVEPKAHSQAHALRDRGQKPSPAVQEEKAQRREQSQDGGRDEEGEDRHFYGPMLWTSQVDPPPVDLQEFVAAKNKEPDHLEDQEHADCPYRSVRCLLWFCQGLSAFSRLPVNSTARSECSLTARVDRPEISHRHFYEFG